MKQIKTILTSFLVLFPVLAHADENDPPIYSGYRIFNGVATGKSVSAATGGTTYTLTLETFATGEKSNVHVSAPADIVLVLDLSQSMTQGYKYTKHENTGGYSYNTVNNSSVNLYYLHSDGNYYQVEVSGNNNNNRRLRFNTGSAFQSDWWYLNGTTAQHNTTGLPSAGTNTVIYTGDLYERINTRLEALQDAVKSFVEVIYHNDNFEDDTDNHPRKNGPLGNRISIVTFGGPQGNNTVTRINSNLTNVTNADGTKNTSMISDLIGLTNSSINNQQHYGTYADEGMNLANTVLGGIPASRIEESSRTVVLFTDGAPGSGPGWNEGTGSQDSNTIANSVIGGPATNPSGALKAKQTYDATVFTVILGDIANTTMGNYLDYASSNYPNAQSLTNPGTAAGGETDFSLEAGDDLEGVFTTIAHSSGGSEKTIPAESMVVDAVSSSFQVPSTFKATDVVVYYRTINAEGTQWVGTATTTPLTKVILPENYDLTKLPPDDIAAQIADENTVGVYLKDGKLMIIGFNYSKADGDGEDGSTNHPYTGNWVGWRTTDDGQICAGREVVIEFSIETIDGATGGDHTNTNTTPSGVYIPSYDDQGNFLGFISANSYPYPDTDLPINLVIEKTGLKHGESATIQIYRAPQKQGEYDSITGKPAPDLTNGWENFSKVILTNKGNDGATVTKKLLSLDPKYVYRLKEDDWGWGYNLDTHEYNTSAKESNPFTFTNTEKTTGVPKHAEAVSINHFGEGARAETYKSSKTGYFTNTNTTETE